MFPLALVVVASFSCIASATAVVTAAGKLMRAEDLSRHNSESEDVERTGNHATDPVLRNISADPHDGKIKAGYCANFLEGGVLRVPAEAASHWGTSDHLSRDQCFTNCDHGFACEQAVYDPHTEECWHGTNAMNQDPDPQQCPGTEKSCICYGKRGFSSTLTFNVKDGWCTGFQEGWGGASPTQCDLAAVSTVKNTCSHWGAEFGLSERGCWSMCQENPLCTQAVYEDKENSWSCYIGTNPMSADPGPSRCADCNNKCYAPFGFSGGTAPVVAGH